MAGTNKVERDAYRRKALSSFYKAVTLNKKYAKAYYYIGVTHMKLGEDSDAVRNLRLALDYGLSGDDARDAHTFLNRLGAD